MYKDLQDFCKDSSKKDGLSCQCRPCKQIQRTKWRKKNMDHVNQYVREFQSKGIKRPRPPSKWKTGKLFIKESKEQAGRCEKCGYSKYIEILQYHHKDPLTKVFEIAHSGARPVEDIRLEIAKCLLLCPTCHAEEHLGGKNKKYKNIVT